ncbi:MAG: DUF2142 domain-containing protein, partial [Novosphingobium sp.]
KASRAWHPAPAPLIAATAAALLFIGWFAMVAHLTVPMMPGRPLPADQLRYVMAHPLAFPKALAGTYGLYGLFDHSRTLVTFGWLSVGPVVPAWFASLAAVLLVLAGGTGLGPALGCGWRIWLAAVSLLVVIVLSFALYLAATALGAGAVDGLQGRYFIPVFLPLLLAIGRQGQPARPNVPLLVAVLMLIANVSSLLAMVGAFYA